MARPAISAMGVVYEALGFAVRHYGTVLRVAWLPLVLLMVLQAVAARLGLVPPLANIATHLRLDVGYTFKLVGSLFTGSVPLIAVMAVGAVLHAAMMVPLIRYAALGERPTHHTIQLRFGIRHFKYILASAASFALVLILTQLVLALLSGVAQGAVIGALRMERPVFEEGSLHRIETEPVFGALGSSLLWIDRLFASMGVPINVVHAAVMIPVLLIGGYVMVRLFAFPPLTAASGPEGVDHPLQRSFAVSGGFNVFPLLAVILVFVLIHAAVVGAVYLSTTMIALAATGTALADGTLAFLGLDTAMAPLLRGGVAVIYAGGMLAVSAFMAGLHAGLGGALVRRAAANE